MRYYLLQACSLTADSANTQGFFLKPGKPSCCRQPKWLLGELLQCSWVSWVAKRSFFLLVLYCTSEACLMGSVTVINLSVVSTIIRQVQKVLGSWVCGRIQFVLLFELWSVSTESIWLAPHLSKLPTACVWLLKNNENLILGEGTDCVCTWQPTSCCSWDCLRHSMEQWAHLTEKCPFSLRSCWVCQHLTGTLSLARLPFPNHWTWQKSM